MAAAHFAPRPFERGSFSPPALLYSHINNGKCHNVSENNDHEFLIMPPPLASINQGANKNLPIINVSPWSNSMVGVINASVNQLMVSNMGVNESGNLTLPKTMFFNYR